MSVDTAPILLRPARATDLDAVVAIEQVSFSDPPWSRRSFAPLVGDPRVRFLVAVEPPGPLAARPVGDSAHGGASDVVLGYVVAWIVADEAEIANLAVMTDRRRAGIGRRLLEAAVSEARMAEARMLYLEVREGNVAARTLYASRGFVLMGRRSQYYRNPSEDALVLRLDLRVLPDRDHADRAAH